MVYIAGAGPTTDLSAGPLHDLYREGRGGD